MTAQWLLQSPLQNRIEMFRGPVLPDSPFRSGSDPFLRPPCACFGVTCNRSARFDTFPHRTQPFLTCRDKTKSP